MHLLVWVIPLLFILNSEQIQAGIERPCETKAENCNKDTKICEENGNECSCLLPNTIDVDKKECKPKPCETKAENCNKDTKICEENGNKCLCESPNKIDGKKHVCQLSICEKDLCNNGNCSMMSNGEYKCNCTDINYDPSTNCLCEIKCNSTTCGTEDATCTSICKSDFSTHICFCNNPQRKYNEDLQSCEEPKADPCLSITCPTFYKCEAGKCSCKDKNLCDPCSNCTGSNRKCTSRGSVSICECEDGFVEEFKNDELICGKTCPKKCMQNCSYEPLKCSCYHGFTLDDDGFTCNLNKEHKCTKYCGNGICVKSGDNKETCQCNSKGYQWSIETNTCEDINECELKEYHCRSLEKCENNNGGYDCVCNETISFMNKTAKACEDIDECINPSTCTDNEICENLIGGYLCKCIAGYYRNENGICQEFCNETERATCEVQNKLCKNDKDRANCICKPQYYTEGDKCLKAASALPGSITIDLPLNSKTHGVGKYTYEEFEEEFSNTILRILSVTSQKQEVKIFSMRNGSTILDFQIINKKGPLNVVDINQKLSDAVYRKNENDGFFGGIFPIKNPDAIQNAVTNEWCESETVKNTCPSYMFKCNKIGTSYTCKCRTPNYIAHSPNSDVQSLCFDNDECLNNLHNCTEDQDCKNTFGSFECHCKPGFKKISENECVEICKDNPCKNNGTCYPNLESNGYFCKCSSGYVGENCSSEIEIEPKNVKESSTAGLQAGIGVLAALLVVGMIVGGIFIYRHKIGAKDTNDAQHELPLTANQDFRSGKEHSLHGYDNPERNVGGNRQNQYNYNKPEPSGNRQNSYDYNNAERNRQNSYDYNNAERPRNGKKQYDYNNAERSRNGQNQYNNGNAERFRNRQSQYDYDNPGCSRNRQNQNDYNNPDRFGNKLNPSQGNLGRYDHRWNRLSHDNSDSYY